MSRREGRAEKRHRPVEGASLFPLPGSLDKGGPQGGEPVHDLPARPFRPFAGALARGAGLLEPSGLFCKPHGPLQVRGVNAQVLADGPGRPGFEGRSLRLYWYGAAPFPERQASERPLQARRPEGLQEKEDLRGSERW